MWPGWCNAAHAKAYGRIRLITGDITALKVEAIVNAANESLLGGGGVDGAIHRAAGPGLLAECRRLGGCPTGQARTTRGHALSAAWVIHTVGPIWRGGGCAEAQLLADAYRNALIEALKVGAASLAFPAISTGAYGYPKEEAARVAVHTIRDFLAEHDMPQQLVLACFSEESAQAHERALHELLPEWKSCGDAKV